MSDKTMFWIGITGLIIIFGVLAYGMTLYTFGGYR